MAAEGTLLRVADGAEVPPPAPAARGINRLPHHLLVKILQASWVKGWPFVDNTGNHGLKFRQVSRAFCRAVDEGIEEYACSAMFNSKRNGHLLLQAGRCLEQAGQRWPNLKDLTFKCDGGLDYFQYVVGVIVQNCPRLQRLALERELVEDKDLWVAKDVVGGPFLSELSPLGELVDLKVAGFSHYWAEGLSSLFRLRRLELENVLKVVELPPGLSELSTMNNFCADREVLGLSASMLKLGELKVLTIEKTAFGEAIRLPSSLVRLRVKGDSTFSGIAESVHLPHLEFLSINLSNEKYLALLTRVPNLCELELIDVGIFQMLRLDALSQLTKLGVYRDRYLSAVSVLGGLSNLTELEILECPQLDLGGQISSLTNLQKLCLVKVGNAYGLLPDLSPLIQLRSLEIGGNEKATQVPGLQALPALESLSLSNLPSMLFTKDVVLPPSLRTLEIRGCPNVSTLVLPTLPSLHFVKIDNIMQ